MTTLVRAAALLVLGAFLALWGVIVGVTWVMAAAAGPEKTCACDFCEFNRVTAEYDAS